MTSHSNDTNVGHSRIKIVDAQEAVAGGTPRLADWRHIPFLAVDSPQTNVVEDGIAVREFARKEANWSADLKVVHPLPLDGPASLVAAEPQICLGIRDTVVHNGGLRPALSLVVATNLTRLTDRQANAILNRRAHTVSGIAGEHQINPEKLKALKRSLASMQTAAAKLSLRNGGGITVEHMVSIVVNHVQRAAIKASRMLASCPPIVVLRAEGSRTFTATEAQQRGLSPTSDSGLITVAAGKNVPTLLQPGEMAEQYDLLRLKERGNSGAINITQITCALLGITPLPAELVRQGLRDNSELDRWKKGGPLPEPLAVAIAQKRNEIREVLARLR